MNLSDRRNPGEIKLPNPQTMKGGDEKGVSLIWILWASDARLSDGANHAPSARACSAPRTATGAPFLFLNAFIDIKNVKGSGEGSAVVPSPLKGHISISYVLWY